MLSKQMPLEGKYNTVGTENLQLTSAFLYCYLKDSFNSWLHDLIFILSDVKW